MMADHLDEPPQKRVKMDPTDISLFLDENLPDELVSPNGEKPHSSGVTKNSTSGPNAVGGPNEPPAQGPGPSSGPGSVGVGVGVGGICAAGGAGGDVPDDCKQIQEQLMLLLHAHKCNRRENLNPNREVCNVNYCKDFIALLAHMGTCKQSKDCTMQHCASSRQILLHYKTCTNSACIVCYPFRQNHSVVQNTNVPPGGAGGNAGDAPGAGGAGGDTNDKQQLKVAQVHPQSHVVGGAGGAAAGAGASGGQQVAAGSSVLMPADTTGSGNASNPNQNAGAGAGGSGAAAPGGSGGGGGSGAPGDSEKDWRDMVPADLRNYLVHKLVQAIFPTSDPTTMQDQRMHNLVSNAEKVEKEVYEMAKSRSEYYHLLAEKIYKVQKDQQMWMQQQEQQQQNPGAVRLMQQMIQQQEQRRLQQQEQQRLQQQQQQVQNRRRGLPPPAA